MSHARCLLRIVELASVWGISFHRPLGDTLYYMYMSIAADDSIIIINKHFDIRMY